MSWATEKLGDIAEFSNGLNFDKTAYGEGIHIIGVSDFANNFYPCYDTLSQIKEEYVNEKSLLEDGDIVFVRSNGNKELVGRCMLISKPPIPVTYSGFCIRCRMIKPELYSPMFFTYYFKSTFFRHALSGTAIGANIQNLSQKRLSNVDCPIPHINTQERIAEILSCYDKLIENNQKQIKLLEEAAQRLYKEWFIDLRFPGHETTPIVNGIPERWTKSTFMDVCSKINAGGTPSRRKREYWKNPSIKWFKTGELFDEWLIDSEEMISEDGLFNSSAKLFPKNTIAMAIYASPTLGRLGIFESTSACNQAMLCMLADETKITWQWLFFKLYENREKFNAIAKGAGQQNISSDTVKNTAIILPTKQTIDLFTNQVKVTFEKRLILQKQIKSLTEARDRLLPKLMSGEIEV